MSRNSLPLGRGGCQDQRIEYSAEQFAQRLFESCNSNKVEKAASNCLDLLRMQNP